MVEISFPPPYTLRFSKKANRVSLRISPQNGLEVIIPEWRKRQPNIPNLLNEKRAWIEKNAKLLQQAENFQKSPLLKPFFLDLKAIHNLIHFSYHLTSNKLIKIKANPLIPNSYQVIGPIDNDPLVFHAIRLHLKHLASLHLSPWIKQISDDIGLEYNSIAIRSQSTLWGSCTASKKISLNCKLLFLPDYLVRYILIHEVCHLKYLNHSKRFWNLVQIYDPNYEEHKKLIKKNAALYLPNWIE